MKLCYLKRIWLVLFLISSICLTYVQAEVADEQNQNVNLQADSNDFNIDVGGDWLNTGVYTPGTGGVTLNGNSDQTISNLLGETFNDLSLTKSSGDVNLGGNVNISGSLTMGGGDIITSDKLLVIGTGTGNDRDSTRHSLYAQFHDTLVFF